MTVAVKICGLTDPAMAPAVVKAGAAYIGLVFYTRSPRFISDALAREISQETPRPAKRVGLFVDPHDADLEVTIETVPMEIIQLHGQESPDRVAAIKEKYKKPVMKALGIRDLADLGRAHDFDQIADWLLFDARPPEGMDRPGGNGIVFDWSLLAGKQWSRPWMLSGGLTPGNVREAITISGASAVDVSSGVETRPGQKNVDLVHAFLAAAN